MEVFPTKQFQHESEFKGILDFLIDLKKKLGQERRGQRYKDIELPTNQSMCINSIFAYFIARLGMSIPLLTYPINEEGLERNFLEESIIIVCLVRKFLNEKGYSLAGVDLNSVTNYPEYCSIKKNSVEVLIDGLDEFFYESFPCYLSNILR